MSYRKALERLEALTEEQRELTALTYERAGRYCAIGALCPSTRRHSGPIAVVAEVRAEVAADIESVGMTVEEAIQLQAVNDRVALSLRVRYERVVDWLRSQVAKEGAR